MADPNTDWLSYAGPLVPSRPSEAQAKLDSDAAKFAYNPDDSSIRHPHPHGQESYDAAGDMDDFRRRTNPNTPKTGEPKPTTPADPTPTRKDSPTTPGTSSLPVAEKPDRDTFPSIPITFFCWKAGKLGYIDLHAKFAFTEQA